MSEELNRINPTVVEGAEDIHGAEGHEAEMYSPMMQNKFAFRDAMRRSRDTLTEKQVGDLMRMRRFGRGAYGAESKFDELSDEIAEQYEKKGMSKEEAEKIGDATAYKVGVAKYGKRGMARKAKVGMDKKKMKAEQLNNEDYDSLKTASNVITDMRHKSLFSEPKERYLHETVNDGLHIMIREQNQKRRTPPFRMEAHEAEGLGNILGNVIPEPHFMGMEEIIREKNKNQNMKDAQGYDDKLDESMGMSMRESKMKQSMKDRRDESKGMEKGMGRRAYQRVKTMDKDSESFEANEEAVEQTDANMVNEGSVDAFYGSGAKVDTSGIELQPISNPSVDEAFDVGNDVGIDVAEQEVMNVNPSVEVNYGAEGDGFVVVKRPHHMARVANHPSKIYNKQMIASSKPGGYHNQMYREGKMYDDETGGFIKITDEHRGNIIDTTQDLLAKGGVRVGGMTASALVIAVAGLSGYYFAKR